jgi:secondary thiamine-phosphate synthase enzyme
MEFNSLDAQRDACEAYVTSQKAEGWVALRDRYDDGGFSGGTLDRPALKQLISDIEAGLIDVIVVYKIDRLSRSLMDFARLVEVFDRNNVTFVSVTQAFNTTTSMGRLTLNILLSFAQFEREVIGERIRDKFAASRKRGMWMGGLVPMGYDVKDRKLVVNEAEERLLADIERHFLALTPPERPYAHNDLHLRPGIPADEPRNAHAHLIALKLGNHLSLPVVDGRLGLGRYQAVLLVELDGPRQRQVLLQLSGVGRDAGG